MCVYVVGKVQSRPLLTMAYDFIDIEYKGAAKRNNYIMISA